MKKLIKKIGISIKLALSFEKELNKLARILRIRRPTKFEKAVQVIERHLEKELKNDIAKNWEIYSFNLDFNDPINTHRAWIRNKNDGSKIESFQIDESGKKRQ